MKMLSNENGYSLLVTLLIVLVFAVLGASLMAMTFNGTTRNDTREAVNQAQDQATKGIKRIEEQIHYELSKDIPSTGFTNTQFEVYFNNIISKYRCLSKPANSKEILNSVDNGYGNFEVCISDILNSTTTPESRTKKQLVFKSVGNRNGKNNILYETVEMGAEDVQKVLNYTISTFKKGETGGNLYLHGGSEITGDMNIDGNIFSTNNGYGDGGWLESALPMSLPTLNESNKLITSKLNLGGKAYTFKNNVNRSYSYSSHIRSGFNSTEYKEISDSNYPGLFRNNHYPQISKSIEDIAPVDFTKEFNFNKQGHINERNSVTLNNTETVRDAKTYEKNLTIRGNNIDVKFNKNIYIKGNLTIGNSSDSAYRNLSIEGKHIYVDGSVTINKVNLQANFTLFAKESVSIQYVTISGIKDTTIPRGSLIVFSDGNFILSNLSEFQDTPSLVNGFFYSSGTMELYGFGSNTKIVGGVAANNIVLNAMKGKAKRNLSEWDKTTQTGTKEECRYSWSSPGYGWEYSGWFTWCREVPDINTVPQPYQEINNHYYETRQNQESAPSRLQILYNHDLLNTYRNSIDYTNTVILKDSIIEPKVINRTYSP